MVKNDIYLFRNANNILNLNAAHNKPSPFDTAAQVELICASVKDF